MKKYFLSALATSALALSAVAAPQTLSETGAENKAIRLETGSVTELHRLQISDHLLFADAASGDRTGCSMTMSAWLRIPGDFSTSYSNQRALMGHRAEWYTNTNGSMNLVLNSGNQFATVSGAGNKSVNPLGDQALVPGEWAFITMTYDQPTNTFCYYKDGELMSSFDNENGGVWKLFGDHGTANGVECSTVFFIGGAYVSVDIDEVQFFNRALSAAEVSTSMDAANGMNGLVALYDFNAPTADGVYPNVATGSDAKTDISANVCKINAAYSSSVWAEYLTGRANYAPEVLAGRELAPEESDAIKSIKATLKAANDLMLLYKESVPAAADVIDGYINQIAGLESQAALFESYADQFQNVVNAQVIDPAEVDIKKVIAANMDQAWTLYQPVQPGYLSAVTATPKVGVKTFAYQQEIDANAYWTLVAGATDGQFYLKSAKGQFIGTPVVNYCSALDAQPTDGNNGLFTIALKDGYVNFVSVAHPGNGLGLDCKNDPAEILSLNDGSNGYRWQVTFSEPKEPEESDAIKSIKATLKAANDLMLVYKQSVPAAAETIDQYIAKIEGLESQAELFESYANQFQYVVNAQVIDPAEVDIKAVIAANMDKAWTLYQPVQPGYLSAVTVSPKTGVTSFNYQDEINADAYWTLVPAATEGQFYLKSAKGQYIGTPNVNYCQALDAQPTDGNNGLFTIALKDGYVNFVSVQHPGNGLGLDCQNDPAEILSLTDGSNGYRWQVTFTEPTVDHVYVTFEAYRQDDGGNHWGKWLQDAETAIKGNPARNGLSTLSGTDDYTLRCVWELTPGTEEGAYYVQNYVTKKYLVKLQAYNNQVVDEPVNIWFPAFSRGGKEGVQICLAATPANNNCIDADNCDQLTGVWGNDNGNLFFKEVLPAVTPEALEALFTTVDPEAVVTAAFNDAYALADLYKESVPAAADKIDEYVGTIKMLYDPTMFVDQYETIDELVDGLISNPVETLALNALNENTGKQWILYQPVQPGYLSANLKSTNQGWDSFNYQDEINADAYWTLVPGAKEGQYYLKSAKGQWIGTPRVHYCQALDEQPTDEYNGLFTIALKDGYVIFPSVSYQGNALGLDCLNDPAEILSLNNEKHGYRWQVTFVEPKPVDLAGAFADRVEEIETYGNRYLNTVGVASDESKYLISTIADYYDRAEELTAGLATEEEAIHKADMLILMPIEASLLNDIYAVATTSTWQFRNRKMAQEGNPSYMSSQLCIPGNADYMWYTVQESPEDVRTNWTFQAVEGKENTYQLFNSDGQQVYANAQWAGCRFRELFGGHCKQPVNFRFGLKEGAVQLITDLVAATCYMSVNSFPDNMLFAGGADDPYALWSISTVSSAVEPEAVKVNVTPAEFDVAGVATVTVALETEEAYDVNADATEMITITKDGEAFKTITPAEVTFDEQANAYAFEVDFAEVGEYVMTIPEGFFAGEKVYNEATTVTWSVKTTGIGIITADQLENAEIFDLAGRRVSKPANGVYIVNGVKMMIRK